MNNYHLHFFMAFLLAMIFFTTSTNAQTNSSDISVNVSANVVSSIEMITVQSMKLSEVEAINDVIQINPQNSTYAGKIVAIGNPNAEIRISFLEQRELTQQQGASNLLFNYEVTGNMQDDQSSSEVLERENRDLRLNSEGRFYLWVGGNVDISTANPGSYQGEFTLEVDYI